MKNWKITQYNLSKNICFSFSAYFLGFFLYVMFYTYICYWNTTFQYKYIIQITFPVVKQPYARVTSKVFVYALSYYLFACFHFVSTSFYLMKLSPSFVFQLTHLCIVISKICAKFPSRISLLLFVFIEK